tara:strand:- start:1243 stop:1854 length:612 start_codon:yes stop_codon:yes gene_type:complete
MYQPLKAETDDWKTGDLILFKHKNSCFGKMIKFFTGSDYTHVGIILRNPGFTNPPLIGLFFWESSDENFPDAEDHKKKIGVEIVDLGELISRVGTIKLFYRKLTLNNGFTIDNSRLKEIHETVHNKPYDIVPLDWIEAYLQYDLNPQKRDRFWCSAFAGYVYVQLGLLPYNTDWSIMRPSDFSSERKDFPLINAKLSKEVPIN